MDRVFYERVARLPALLATVAGLGSETHLRREFLITMPRVEALVGVVVRLEGALVGRNWESEQFVEAIAKTNKRALCPVHNEGGCSGVHTVGAFNFLPSDWIFSVPISQVSD